MACLGEVSRFDLVRALTTGSWCVTELATQVGLSQSCTTRHLQALEREGVVRAKRDGKRVIYGLCLEQPRVADLIGWALSPHPVPRVTIEDPTIRSQGTPGSTKSPARRRPPSKPAPEPVNEDRVVPSEHAQAEDTPAFHRRSSDIEDFLL